MRKLSMAMLVVVALCLPALGARAEVPNLIPVVGVLTDTDDAPLDGDYTVVFTLYDAETGGVILGGETQDVEFEDGLFRVYLGSATLGGLSITPFIDNEEVWLGVRVGADGEMNRVRMASVPWAFEAETCGRVTDLAAAGIQQEIEADACAAGFAMRGWDGSAAVCVALPSTAGLVADTDIGVTVQAPINQTSFPCNYGIQQIGVDGSTVCANQDVVTQCGPEAGLGSNDNYLGSDGACHKAAHSCGDNHTVTGGATPECQGTVPTGAVMMFNLAACPTGWSELTAARGMALVGLPSGGTLGGGAGTALTDQQSPAHTHDVSLTSGAAGQHNHAWSYVTTSENWRTYDSTGTSFEMINWGDGYGNEGSDLFSPGIEDGDSDVTTEQHFYTDNEPAHAHVVAGDTGATAGHLPYIQLLVCVKD